jgi:hypothetical protein
LFDRTYDAIGFWAYAEHPWRLLNEASSLAWESGSGNTTRLSRQLLATVREEQGLAPWAMSYLQRPTLGAEWFTVGPGLGDEHPPPAEAVTLYAGSTEPIDGAVRGFTYRDLQFESDVEVLKIEPRADGALHWGHSDDGPDGTFVGRGSETL